MQDINQMWQEKEDAENAREEALNEHLGKMEDIENQKASLEEMTTSFLDWIKSKITDLNDHNFPDSSEAIKTLLHKHDEYKTIEKQSKKDIDQMWQQLEEAENAREVALLEYQVETAVNELSSTVDSKVAMTCLELLQSLLCEKRSLTYQIPEYQIIADALLKQLQATKNDGIAQTCLALTQHLLIEEGSVTFDLSNINIIAGAALKHLGDTKDHGVATSCLALLQHYANKEEEEIEILVHCGVIEVVVSLLRRSFTADDQALPTISAVAWNIIAMVLDDSVSNCRTFIEIEGTPIIQEQLQKFPGKDYSITNIVKSISQLADDAYDIADVLMHAPTLRDLMWIINATTEAQFPVRYWAADSLVKLANKFDEPEGHWAWTVEQPSRTQVNDEVFKAVSQWRVDVEPPQEHRSFRSPLVDLAYGTSRYPASRLRGCSQMQPHTTLDVIVLSWRKKWIGDRIKELDYKYFRDA